MIYLLVNLEADNVGQLSAIVSRDKNMFIQFQSRRPTPQACSSVVPFDTVMYRAQGYRLESNSMSCVSRMRFIACCVTVE